MPLPINYRQLGLAVRYKTIIFPFDSLRFLRVLQQQGFTPTEEIGEVPFGARVNVTGIIARRAEASVRIDSDKQVVGVLAPNPTQAAEEFSVIEKLIFSEFNIDNSKIANFYEFIGSADVNSMKNPQEQFAALFAESTIIQKLSVAIGKQSSPFGVRLVPKDGTLNSTNWYEIQITPSIHAPSQVFDFQVVFRNPQRDDVLGFAKALDATIASLISVVEQ